MMHVSSSTPGRRPPKAKQRKFSSARKHQETRAHVVVGLLCALALFSPWFAENVALGEPLQRVLIVTGEDYKGHRWPQTTPVLKQHIGKDKRFAVTVLDDLTKLSATNLADYAVVVMHFKNYDPQVPGREGFDKLRQYVERGGGLVLVHFACGAFQEFKEDFAVLAGRAWNPELRGHDRRGEFRVEIADADHPITRGLKPFDTTDELYTCLAGDAPITILATAVSKVDQKIYPMAFVLEHGKGRVFHSVLGHDVEAFNNDVGELYRRGVAWTAALEPVAKPEPVETAP